MALKDEIGKLSGEAQAEYDALTRVFATEMVHGESLVVEAVKSHVAWVVCFAAGVVFGALAHML